MPALFSDHMVIQRERPGHITQDSMDQITGQAIGTGLITQNTVDTSEGSGGINAPDNTQEESPGHSRRATT